MKRQQNKSLIVLMSDFGLTDPYVGIMKGIILDINPTCSLIDLTHGVRPQDTLQASFLLSSTFREFPENTVFVCVVDPGVGTRRKPVLVHAFGAYFVGPDNGIFGFLNDDPHKKIVHLINEKFFKTPVSKTFHGRDIFAPVAAHLTSIGPGIISELGEEQPELLDIEGRFPLIAPDGIEGTVVHIDRFGNLISNIHANHVASLTQGRSDIRIAFRGNVLPLFETFAEAPAGQPCALIGSSSHLEIFVRNESAEKTLEVRTGEKIHVYKHYE